MTPGRWPRREIARIGLAALLLWAGSAATAFARNPLKLPDTQYEPIAWAMIDGWADDDHNAAFETFFFALPAFDFAMLLPDGFLPDDFFFAAGFADLRALLLAITPPVM